MRVVVDYDRCEANGLCVQLAPATFELGQDEVLVVTNPDVTADQRPQVEAAERACPKLAITLVDQ